MDRRTAFADVGRVTAGWLPLLKPTNRVYLQTHGYFPPGRFALPPDAPALCKRIAGDMLNVGQYAMCWDVRLDPVTTDLLGAEINALAQGILTPQEFARKIDDSIKENAPKFFK